MAAGFFAFDGDLRHEMSRLRDLQQHDPESAQNLMLNGQICVDLVAQRQLKVLRQVTVELQTPWTSSRSSSSSSREQAPPLLCFYMVKMFKLACTSRQLDLLAFMVQNGFDLHKCGLHDMVHQVVESLPDADEQASDAMQPVVRFLLDWGLDVNWQRPSDLFTALHIACRKNLYSIAYLLLVYGADVNAVAKHDEMPLLCAEQAARTPSPALSPQEKRQNELLIELLVQHDAKRDWRRPKAKLAPSRVQVVSFSGSCGRMFDTSTPA